MTCRLSRRACADSLSSWLSILAARSSQQRYINTAIEVDSSANPFIATSALAAHAVQSSAQISSPTTPTSSSASVRPAPSRYSIPALHTPGLFLPISSAISPRYNPSRAPQPPSQSSNPLRLSDDLRAGLARLSVQPPFYATIHLHGKPYLVTAGDTVRLPFIMHGVRPGDILRLTRLTTLGSRDFTMRGGHASGAIGEQATLAQPLIGRTDGTQLPETHAPRGRPSPAAYLDERLFTCRATVLGTESEPMRTKIKTKQRQRRVKKVESKHRYTILRIGELDINRDVLA